MTEITFEMRAAAVAHVIEEDSPQGFTEGYTFYETDAPMVMIGDREYVALTDDEATAAARAEVARLAWAFRSKFLAEFTGFPVAVFDAIQGNEQCEDNNEAMLALISANGRTVEEFADEAIDADGRGHQLSGYDGEEHEVPAGTYAFDADDDAESLTVTLPEMLYVYRIN